MKAKGRGLLLGLVLCALLDAAPARAIDRIAAPLRGAAARPLPGSRHPLARPERALGRLEASLRLDGVALHVRPSPAQQAELEALLLRQQDPASPDYHRWLTPEAYGARFGLSDDDLAQVTAWLAAQGLEVQAVARGRDQVTFGGTVARLEAAFRTELRGFDVDGERHFAPAGELSIPAPLVGIVAGVSNLDDFRPRSRAHVSTAPAPRYTNGSANVEHFLTPNDVATLYDVAALYDAGYDGAGQTIAVIGQSDLDLTAVEAFRSAAARTAGPAPTKLQVPSSGKPVTRSGDAEEAALDVEWSSALAPGAQVVYVFTGDAAGMNAWNALTYIVDQDLAPVVSVSYGVCEAQAGSGATWLRGTLQKAQAQGQSVIAASGDSGAAGCDTSAPAIGGLDTDLPASFPEVTGVGGTKLSGDLSSPATYWRASNDSGGGSARGYIPEIAWNDSGATLAASGGGVSGLYAKPAWQVAVGVPADGQRDVPDIALAASAQHDAYLYCASGGCTQGFADGSGYVHLIGGTSAGAPVFSGVVAVLVQVTGGGRLGLLNPTLYALAASDPQAFHDVTSGDNLVPCQSGRPDCPAGLELGYAAGSGYDPVTGLGSIDAYQLAAAWPGNGLGRTVTATQLAASHASAAPGTAITFTATVTAGGAAVPDGATVRFAADGVALASPVALSGGQAALVVSTLASGSHAVTATYAGDPQYAPSVSSAVHVTVTGGGTSGGGGGCGTGGPGDLAALALLAGLALARRRRRV